MEAFHQALIRDLSSEEGFPLPANLGLRIEIQAFRGKPFNVCQDLVKEHFNGGETVYAKVFDEDGNQWVKAYPQGWIPRP